MSKIDRRGGGQHFSNKSEIQKSLKHPIRGGGQAYFGKFPKFSHFFNYETCPKGLRGFWISRILGGIMSFVAYGL